MTPPLAGLRVLDLTRLLPGPWAAQQLLRWGAEVTKVEGLAERGQSDEGRALWQTAEQAAQGTPGPFFRALNDGKRPLRLDLRSEAGRAELLARAREADVLIEGFRPGALARLGLGWPVLRSANPRLVLASISGYGQSGPWAERAGHDINYVAMAGVLGQIVSHGGEPALPNFQIGDLMGGTQAALAELLAALYAVQRGGAGRWLDISMTHEVWRHHVVARTALAAFGRPPPPARDLLSGGVPCYGLYRTQDGRHLAVGALEQRFWAVFCGAIGEPAWAAQHWSLGQAIGGPEAMALRDAVARRLAERPLAAWLPLFDAADCCVTPVLGVDEAAAHPLFAGR